MITTVEMIRAMLEAIAARLSLTFLVQHGMKIPAIQHGVKMNLHARTGAAAVPLC